MVIIMNNYKFGNYITQLREQKGFTQAELGLLINVSDKTVSKWENGQALPRMETFEKLAEVLGTTVEDFISAGKENVIRVSFRNEFAEVAYLEVEGQYISIPYNETKVLELSSNTFTANISFKIDFDTNEEYDSGFIEKFLNKTLTKLSASVMKDILLVECVYKFSLSDDSTNINISDGVVNLGDIAFVFQNFLMYYPKIEIANCELVSAKALNSRDVVKRFNKKAVVHDLGLDFIIAIFSYPLRGLYLKHYCKPRVIKKNILNAEKLNAKNGGKNKKGCGCFSSVLLVFLILVYSVFIHPILFLESDSPALVSSDFSQIEFYNDVYVRVSELPQDAEYEGFLGTDCWYNARIDGCSRLDQVVQDHKVCVYKTADGTEYLWLVLNYTDNITDDEGEYIEYEDFESPLVYKIEK